MAFASLRWVVALPRKAEPTYGYGVSLNLAGSAHDGPSRLISQQMLDTSLEFQEAVLVFPLYLQLETKNVARDMRETLA